MNKYNSTKTVTKGLRKSKIILPQISLSDGNETGVSVTSYGQGQLTGGMFTVPAHGKITVDFKLRLICVTPEDIQNLNQLIRSLLDASHQHVFDELSKTEVSGGVSFFCFFGWGGASASYSDTKHTMDSFGLSEVNQEAIVNAMMKIVTTPSEFNYNGTIDNTNYDYDVTGNLFGIVMDAVIQQDQHQNQVRLKFLAPNVHLRTNDGENLPVVGQLYNP